MPTTKLNYWISMFLLRGVDISDALIGIGPSFMVHLVYWP